MTRKYKDWTSKEIAAVLEYVETTEHPWSRYKINDLAERLGVSLEQARGAVGRVIRAVREQRR